jgi:hypothetical protein
MRRALDGPKILLVVSISDELPAPTDAYRFNRRSDQYT